MALKYIWGDMRLCVTFINVPPSEISEGGTFLFSKKRKHILYVLLYEENDIVALIKIS